MVGQIKKSEKTKIEMLQDQLRKLKNIHAKRCVYRRNVIRVGLILIFNTPILYLFGIEKVYVIGILVYGLGLLFSQIVVPQDVKETQIRDLENEIDLLPISEKSIEQRAEKIFKNYQFELKKYYDQTLRQGSMIFIVSISIGFIIIGLTIFFVGTNTFTDVLKVKIVIGVLGAIAGILSNFIAVVYMKMHSGTIKSLTEFHNRLVYTHHLHFGNFLVSKITEKGMRDKTLADISTALANSKM